MLCAQPPKGSHGLQTAGTAPNLLPHSAVAVSSAESLHSLPSSEDDASWQWAPPDGLLDPLTFKFCTALHLAAYYGHVNVLEALQTGAGCDMHARNQQVGCPVQHTAQRAQAPKEASSWGRFTADESLPLPLPVTLSPLLRLSTLPARAGVHSAAHGRASGPREGSLLAGQAGRRGCGCSGQQRAHSPAPCCSSGA